MSDEEQGPVLCEIHDEECRFVCIDCYCMLCDDCISSDDHDEHEVKSVKDFVKNLDPNEINDQGSEDSPKSEVIGEIESRFDNIVQAINLQADTIVEAINKIADKRIQECEEKKSENLSIIDEKVTMVDPYYIMEMIDNLPKKGSRAQYAEVAKKIIWYRYYVGAGINSSEAKLNMPYFKPGKIRQSLLKEQFGKLKFKKEKASNLIENCTESGGSGSYCSDDD